MSDVPELWWSPSRAAAQSERNAMRPDTGLVALDDGEPEGVNGWGEWTALDEFPADAIPLGVIKDPKHRGPAYQRGYRDGVMARDAGITDPEVPHE